MQFANTHSQTFSLSFISLFILVVMTSDVLDYPSLIIIVVIVQVSNVILR